MAKTYKTYLPEQDLLLPPSLRDWLPENHLAYCGSDVVDQLDLSAIESVYEEEDRGQPPYHPRMMTKILVYGYCVGVFSSRRIQKRLVEDVAFRVLAAGNQPDFRTIADFRKLHLQALEELFQQVLRLVLEVGALKLGSVALDGSKVKANASKHKAMSYGRMGEAEKRLREEARNLLMQAEATDEEEDKRYGRERQGDELPEVCLANCNFASRRACHNVTSSRCMLFVSKALLILAKHRSQRWRLKRRGEYLWQTASWWRSARISACRAARVRKLEATKAKRATKRELIVVATMISRMVGTPAFSDRTEFSVCTVADY